MPSANAGSKRTIRRRKQRRSQQARTANTLAEQTVSLKKDFAKLNTKVKQQHINLRQKENTIRSQHLEILDAKNRLAATSLQAKEINVARNIKQQETDAEIRARQSYITEQRQKIQVEEIHQKAATLQDRSHSSVALSTRSVAHTIADKMRIKRELERGEEMASVRSAYVRAYDDVMSGRRTDDYYVKDLERRISDLGGHASGGTVTWRRDVYM